MIDQIGNGRSDPERLGFEKELLSLQHQLKRFASSLTQNSDMADDLVQDTLIRALSSWRAYTPGTNLKAWLFVMARNLFFSQRKRAKFTAAWDPDLADRTLTSDGEVSEAEASLDFHRLLKCLACLSQDKSDALIAVAYLGYSYEEASDRLSCAIGTIKSRVGRGRDELFPWFESTGNIPKVDLTWFRSATTGIPKSHPTYPIAKAYEELFSTFGNDITEGKTNSKPVSDKEAAWRNLIQSGALDLESESLDEMMRE